VGKGNTHSSGAAGQRGDNTASAQRDTENWQRPEGTQGKETLIISIRKFLVAFLVYLFFGLLSLLPPQSSSPLPMRSYPCPCRPLPSPGRA
jgi:hypothetical protein